MLVHVYFGNIFAGLFEPGHMRYEMERENEPSLVEMVERSIKVLERSSKGYFLFVESKCYEILVTNFCR